MEQRTLHIEAALEHVRAALEKGQVQQAIAYLQDLHPADRAETFADLPEDDQQEILPLLNAEDTAELLTELDDDDAARLAAQLPSDQLADVLDEMDADDAADVLGDLPPAKAEEALAQMEEADEVRPLLVYKDDTAGGLMTPDVFALRDQMTAQQAIDFLRQQEFDNGTPYYLYVVDKNDRLCGVTGLRDLIVAHPETPLKRIMQTKVYSVAAGADQEEVANLIKKYNLQALPVVSADNRLVGAVRASDIVYVVEEEAAEDLYRLANISADGDLSAWSPPKVAVSRRLPWLVVNLFTAFLAASVVGLFEATIAQLAVLAVFQSIVAGQGGNAGTQTLAVMVRGIAMGEVSLRDAGPVLGREILVGLMHGLTIGVLVGLGAWLWKGMPLLGLIIGVAMLGNMVAAGVAGTLVPLTLKALKLDPALASAVMVTTVTDCVGFALFLGLATALLPWLR